MSLDFVIKSLHSLVVNSLRRINLTNGLKYAFETISYLNSPLKSLYGFIILAAFYADSKG